MKSKGGISFLPLLVMLVIAALAIGSFVYLNPNFSLYSLYNIGSPEASPAAPSISIDKSDFVKGEVLISFASGTRYDEVKNLLSKHNIMDFESFSRRGNFEDSDVMKSTDLFMLYVEEGKENETVDMFKQDPEVESVTLNYVGSKE